MPLCFFEVHHLCKDVPYRAVMPEWLTWAILLQLGMEIFYVQTQILCKIRLINSARYLSALGSLTCASPGPGRGPGPVQPRKGSMWLFVQAGVCLSTCLCRQWQGTAVKCCVSTASCSLTPFLPWFQLPSLPSLVLLLEGEKVEKRTGFTSSHQVPTLLLLSLQHMSGVYLNTHLQ